MKRREFISSMGMIGAMTLVPSVLLAKGERKRKTDHEKCKAVWTRLCGANADKPPFRYVVNDKKLPNILLYGDSISIGYTPTVMEELQGQANVYRIHRNGASSNQFISYMEALKQSMFQPYLKGGWNFKWDIIHFNVGLHDLKYVVNGSTLDKVNGKQMSTIDIYKSNLEAICKYLQKEFPKATLVFATTTPVPEDEPGRFVGDDVKYNEAALEVLRNYPNIKINDLYAYVLPNFKEWAIKSGNVHYNPNGKKEQGKWVAKIIRSYL
ncbi:MAG: SGNH/GDSL hydrolase family protein [Bacteroidales bacterium]|nr:SGNH/GDSL hydrolase family protein [Bacteroidales bacterium]